MKNRLNKQIEKLLLTPAEMNEVYQKLHKQKFNYPYFYKIVKSKQCLYFLGPHHIFDQKDPQLKTIKKLWNEFLDVTKKKNCIVLIEGGKRPVLKTEKEAIEKHGEPGLMTLLANKENIEVVSPEPDESKEANTVSEKFGREKTIYYYFARQVAQWHRYLGKPDFEKYIRRLLKEYEEVLNWKGFDFSLNHMTQLQDNYHNHKFDKENYDCFYNDSNPINSEVSAASSGYRNTYIVKEILMLWNNGRNIFIVYGSGHAITLEPALKILLN